MFPGDDCGAGDDCVIACAPSGDLVDNDVDCDDAGISPAAVELCDQIDNDCDGIPDPDTCS